MNTFLLCTFGKDSSQQPNHQGNLPIRYVGSFRPPIEQSAWNTSREYFALSDLKMHSSAIRIVSRRDPYGYGRHLPPSLTQLVKGKAWCWCRSLDIAHVHRRSTNVRTIKHKFSVRVGFSERATPTCICILELPRGACTVRAQATPPRAHMPR